MGSRYLKELNIDLDIKRLQDQYLNNYTLPPTPSTTVQKVHDAGFALVAKNIDWDIKSIEQFLGIEFHTSRIFITSPHKKFPIHKDCVGKKNDLREWAINIPLFNCDRGFNTWYEDKPEYEHKQHYVHPAAVSLTHPSPELSHKQPLSNISLVRTDIFHGVDNTDNDYYRVVLSLRSNDNITYNQLCERIDESL